MPDKSYGNEDIESKKINEVQSVSLSLNLGLESSESKSIDNLSKSECKCKPSILVVDDTAFNIAPVKILLREFY